jgi:hypothetical protein
MKLLFYGIVFYLPFVCGKVQAQSHQRTQTIIPPLGRLCGVRVGLDTREAVERRLGKGGETEGDHPRSGREWHLRGSKTFFGVDGLFYNNKDEQIIDSVGISSQSFANDGHPPLLSLSRRKIGLLGVIFLGMTRQEVLRAVHGKLPVPIQKKGQLTWNSKGFARSRGDGGYKVFRKWTTDLYFKGDRLDKITINCD